MVAALKTVHLHVGTGRAASSSIQRFLRDNPQRLQQQNAAYPVLPTLAGERKPPRRTAHALAAYLRVEAGRPGRRRYEGLHKAAGFLGALPQDHIILSSEFLVSLPLEPLDALREIFAMHGLRVIAYCYIRDPFDAVLSNYSEHLQVRCATIDVNEYLREAPFWRQPFGSTLLRKLDILSQAFGDQRFIRLDRHDRLIGGDVRLDLLRAVGLDASGFEMPKEVDRSGNALEIEAMRHLNKLTDLGIWSRRQNQRLLEYTSEAGLAGPEIRDFVDIQLERNIRAFFEPEADAIKAKHFAELEGQLFPSPAFYPDTRPHQSSLDVSKVMRIIAGLIADESGKSTGEFSRSVTGAAVGKTESATQLRTDRDSTPQGTEARRASLNMFTCADRKYEDFAPLYIASCLWSNPDVTVEIGLESTDQFLETYGSAISIIRDRFGPQSFLLRNASFLRPSGRRMLANSVRFITTPNTVSDYVYIGDIDMIVLEGDILGNHLRHMAQTGLPFSNILRDPLRRTGEPQRLTGLHFTRYDALYPLPDFADLYEAKMNDEALLAILVQRKIGNIPTDFERYRPFHGIHISPNRSPHAEVKDGRKIAGWGVGKHQSDWTRFRSTQLFKQLEPHLSQRVAGLVAQVDAFEPRERSRRKAASMSG